MTTLLTKLSGAYDHATLGERLAALIALGSAFAAFLGSAICLIRAVSPYRPRTLDAVIGARYRGVFFPTPDIRGARDPHAEMTRRLDAMGEAEIRDELVAETLKLAGILAHESAQTKWGYRLLFLELLATAGFFVLVAVASL